MTHLITIFAIILSFVLFSIVNMLAALILAPVFGLVVEPISLWGNIFVKKDGVWTRTRGKFTLIAQFSTRLDNTKPIPDKPSKVTLPIDLSLFGLQIVLTTGLFFLFLAMPEGLVPIDWRYVMLWIFIMNVMYCLLNIFSIIRVHFLRNTGLEGYCEQILGYIRRGEEIPASFMKLPEELPFGPSTQKTRIRYFRLYFMYLMWTGQFDRLYLPVHETAAYLRNRTFVISDTGYYYDTVFYYSRFEFDPGAAKYFMDRIRSVLASDPDANAKRVLAYYAYGVENDKEKARFFINEALAVVDKFSVAGMERELERRLITELDERLKGEGY